MSSMDAFEVAIKAKHALTKAGISYGAATVFIGAVMFGVDIEQFDRAREVVFGDTDTRCTALERRDGAKCFACEGRIDGITVKIVALQEATR